MLKFTSLAAAAALLALAVPAAAADGPKPITLGQSVQVLASLRALDARPVVVKENVVMVPWDFGSATLRMKIANAITVMTAAEKSINDAKAASIKEILKGKADTEIKPGTPEMDEFVRQFNDLLAQPAPGARDLPRIQASELRLDKNEIPATVLSGLAPILDQ